MTSALHPRISFLKNGISDFSNPEHRYSNNWF